jgi:hypothetical protein
LQFHIKFKHLRSPSYVLFCPRLGEAKVVLQSQGQETLRKQSTAYLVWHRAGVN